MKERIRKGEEWEKAEKNVEAIRRRTERNEEVKIRVEDGKEREGKSWKREEGRGKTNTEEQSIMEETEKIKVAVKRERKIAEI